MNRQYRGSIVNLRAGTSYEIRVKRQSDADWHIFPTTTTWRDTTDPAFPVKQRIVLGAALSRLATTASGDAGGFCLLPRAGVLVQGALLDGLVDLRGQLALLFLDRARVAGLDRRLQAPEVGLHGAGQQSVLGPLALAAKYPLFL